MFRAIGLRRRHWQQPKLFFIGGFIAATLIWGLIQIQHPLVASAQTTSGFEQPHEQLPALQVHPLPAVLAEWQDETTQGDYFSAIEPTPVGYLVWSEFPVQVFVEPVSASGNAFERDRAQAWIDAVTQAVQEWGRYLPLEFADASETADIAIWRSAPPIQLDTDSQSKATDQANESQANTNQASENRLPRIRSAETQYHLFVDRPIDAPAQLSHRFTIRLTPNQTIDYIQATARHEIGHALGIWGHSPVETDALYFSQVQNPPPISVRDVNTLKQTYQQPTRLGWEIIYNR